MRPGENILLIRFKSIGDILFTLPAVHAVRENFPGAKITFLTSRENAPLLRGFREVDETITIDRAALKSGNLLKILPEFFGLLRRLRGGKFSLAVDFQGYGETAWLARLSGAPRRWGSVYGKGRAWAYTRGPRRDGKIHPADWNLSLLQQCGLNIGGVKNDFVLPEDALAAAGKFFSAQKLDAARPTLFIQPFTSSPQKNWPLENFRGTGIRAGCRSFSAAGRPTGPRWNRPAPKAFALPPVRRCWFPPASPNCLPSCSAATAAWATSRSPPASA
jgi:heptosyltransferase-1